VRIFLDATAIPASRGGVGRYVDALLPALARQGVDLVVACQPRDVPTFAAAVPSSELVPVTRAAGSVPARLAWEQVGLPGVVRRVKPDVVHSPHYTRPLAVGAPVVVTLHDATFFSHPELHRADKARFFRAWTRVAVRRAEVLVVPSQATRAEVVRYTGADPDRFEVVPHGVDHDRFRPVAGSDVRRVRDVLGLGERPYVAFLGTLEPRKNVPALVRGWMAAVAGTPDPPALVLAGGSGWDHAVGQALDEVPAHLRPLVPGYLELDDLAPYLAGATVVAYPSLGEGFGLPVLEAMACGAVVLTTRELSLPEVGGDAVAYCGTSSDEIAHELAGLLADPTRRARLAVAARERASGFTWDAAAAGHLRAYERAVAAARS
jgi:glycosyltransferase involved in cell wall biosynthesis